MDGDRRKKLIRDPKSNAITFPRGVAGGVDKLYPAERWKEAYVKYLVIHTEGFPFLDVDELPDHSKEIELKLTQVSATDAILQMSRFIKRIYAKQKLKKTKDKIPTLADKECNYLIERWSELAPPYSSEEVGILEAECGFKIPSSLWCYLTRISRETAFEGHPKTCTVKDKTLLLGKDQYGKKTMMKANRYGKVEIICERNGDQHRSAFGHNSDIYIYSQMSSCMLHYTKDTKAPIRKRAIDNAGGMKKWAMLSKEERRQVVITTAKELKKTDDTPILQLAEEQVVVEQKTDDASILKQSVSQEVTSSPILVIVLRK